jgi:hypothetical protein
MSKFTFTIMLARMEITSKEDIEVAFIGRVGLWFWKVVSKFSSFKKEQ